MSDDRAGQGGRRKAIGRCWQSSACRLSRSPLGVGFATGNWPASFATGLAISGAIAGLYWLDQRFVHPRLEKLSRTGCAWAWR